MCRGLSFHQGKTLYSGSGDDRCRGAGSYDCVIRQEDTDYGQEQAEIYVEGRPWQNYCRIGEDFQAGTCMIPRRVRLGAGHIAF